PSAGPVLRVVIMTTAAPQRLERTSEQPIEIERGLQERRRPQVKLPWKALYLRFDGSCADVGDLDVAIALIDHRQPDEDVLGVREVISKLWFDGVEERLEVGATIRDGAAGRIGDGSEDRHLPAKDKPL